MVSLEDCVVLAGGLYAINTMLAPRLPNEEETRAVVRRRKERDYAKTINFDAGVVRNKEKALIDRGCPIPDVPYDNPSLYQAKLDLLLQDTSDRTVIYKPIELVGEYPPSLPNAGQKTYASLWDRAGAMAGCTVLVDGPGEEETWRD